jgi:ABC-type antimicrobial peptide transport system permease subunit
MFKTRPMRTFLTVLGVSVGIGAVLFLVSLGYGMQKAILSRITTADSLLSIDVSAGASGALGLNRDKVEKIARIPGVSEVSPAASFSGQISMNEITGDSVINAASSSFFRLSGIVPRVGAVYKEDTGREAVISSAAAQLFNLKPEDAIGKEIEVTLYVPDHSEE